MVSLFSSSLSGHRDCISSLVGSGADVNAKDKKHYTPLHSAAAGGPSHAVKLLLELGADVSERKVVVSQVVWIGEILASTNLSKGERKIDFLVTGGGGLSVSNFFAMNYMYSESIPSPCHF